jgi:hypothetical protein
MELTVQDNYSMINCCVCGRIQRQRFPAAYVKKYFLLYADGYSAKEIKNLSL